MGVELMRKRSAGFFFLRCVVCLVCFAFCGRAHAAAVYLKNGRVMTGRIVEKNEKFIILSAARGESAAKVTIFLEDILRIETDEEYSRQVAKIPFGLFRSESKKPWESPSVLKPSAEMAADPLERIKDLLSEDQRLKAAIEFENPQKKFLEPVDIFIPGIQGASRTGTGSISGSIKLPPAARGKSGDLFVYLMRDKGLGSYSSGEHMFYQKIRKEQIKGRSAVSYMIGNVPPDNYRVFAQWDVTHPLIAEKRKGDNVVLRYLGAKGDYAGSSYKSVAVSENEERQGVDLDVLSLIERDQQRFVFGERPDFLIKDIYHRVLSDQPPQFFVLIKNESEQAINLLAFDVYINDMKILGQPMDVGYLGPFEEKEFNITNIYRLYLNLLRQRQLGSEDSQMAKSLRIKFVWPSTQEIEIEKTLFLL